MSSSNYGLYDSLFLLITKVSYFNSLHIPNIRDLLGIIIANIQKIIYLEGWFRIILHCLK